MNKNSNLNKYLTMKQKAEICELFIGEDVPIVEIGIRMNIHNTTIANIITKYFNKSRKLHSMKRGKIRYKEQLKEYTENNLTITIKSHDRN